MKHDLPVVAADVRAIDVGYYNTKYTKGRVRRGDSSTIEVASFPSVAPSVTPTQVSIGEGSAAGGVVIGVEGVDFFVGPDATTQASASEPRPVSEEYSQNPRYHALNLGALDSMAEHDGAGLDYIIRTLVVGLPLTTFLTYKDKVTNKLRGVHEIKRTGGPVRRRIVVEDVEVIVQPQGALLNRAVGNTRALVGLSVVVDAGGGTLDWFAAVDRKHASAGELAKTASVTPATASGHLGKLLDAQFVVCEPRGRHRYYRLADAEVAHALEALALVAERDGHDKAWEHPDRKRLRFARCCYGHLAGKLGVSVFNTLQRDGRLQSTSGGYELSDSGRAWLQGLGMIPSSPNGRRRFAYRCLDWSERRDHLAGQLADEIYQHFTALGWLRRGSGRAVEITVSGQQELLPHLCADAA